MRHLLGMLRLWVWFVNALMLIFPDDHISTFVTRPFILRHFLGISVGRRTGIRGGSCFLDINRMSVGDDCFINKMCYFDMAGSIVIEDNVVMGHGVTIITAKHKIGPNWRRASVEVESTKVRIGRGSWVGANVTIQPGIIVGRGVVLMPGAVVAKDLPDNALAGGVPAEVKRIMI